ncbi:hypothetical protein, partial [Novosphingobium olei]|uniref:hypothetical protein n=1 Tax=Novosphingobium olei TaxID=2728851 RepID=UPI00197FF4D9
SLYCCSDGVRGRGAPMTYLSHTASFHSNERIAPSNRGIKHLAIGRLRRPADHQVRHIDEKRLRRNPRIGHLGMAKVMQNAAPAK